MSEVKCWEIPWPESELEYVATCPVCESGERKLLHSSLEDRVFMVANGRWELYQCCSCASGFLDPRPNEKSIHKAYGIYYTHKDPISRQKSSFSASQANSIRKRLVNGYYNHYFGTERKPSLSIGRWLLHLYPGFHGKANAMIRYLPKPRAGQLLLDVGCGNGEFLSLAKEVGWVVKGVEPDPTAFEIAKSHGLDVSLGGIEQLSLRKASFDVITISHVIEHVHDPRMLLRAVFELLKPGGVLFVDTPNIEGYCAKAFGVNWRGLEVPRHLVLYSRFGISSLLREQGFRQIEFRHRRDMSKNMALKSRRIELGKSPYDKTYRSLPLTHLIKLIMLRRRESEFLTVLAKKP